MTARGVVRITPADVGARVTIRTRIAHEPGAPGMTDTVGVLESWRDGELRVRKRDGTLASVREADLIAARTIPVRHSVQDSTQTREKGVD